MAIVSSAANLLAQLDEDDEALRLNALQSLNSVVHDFWFQIASSIASVEAFYEDESFTHRELAALVASKVYHCRLHVLLHEHHQEIAQMHCLAKVATSTKLKPCKAQSLASPETDLS